MLAACFRFFFLWYLMDYFIELLFSGLSRGAIYALIALGYTMVYGIIGLINFAHGEIYMIGAFTALIVASVLGLLGWPTLAILVIAALEIGVLALLRHLPGRASDSPSFGARRTELHVLLSWATLLGALGFAIYEAANTAQFTYLERLGVALALSDQQIGSALLVDADTGRLNRRWLESLADEIVRLRERGQQVLVVSSGAIRPALAPASMLFVAMKDTGCGELTPESTVMTGMPASLSRLRSLRSSGLE